MGGGGRVRFVCFANLGDIVLCTNVNKNSVGVLHGCVHKELLPWRACVCE